jgi:hypothetical protein
MTLESREQAAPEARRASAVVSTLPEPQNTELYAIRALPERLSVFGELSALPWCLGDEQKRQERRLKSTQRILAAGLPFPKKSKAPDGVKIES